MRGIRAIIADRRRREDQAFMARHDQEQADLEAEAVIERARQDELAGDVWLERYNQHDRDEEEAYRRNAVMDRQADHINERIQGLGPGYDDAYDLSDREADEINEYLNWCDGAEWGEERGNPPDCVLRDVRLETEAERWPERKAAATEMPRGPDGDWNFSTWAVAHGYSLDDIEWVHGIEARRQLQREGKLGPYPGRDYPQANEHYLNWMDAEEWGNERGNPPESVIRDSTAQRYAEQYPERKPAYVATEMERGPNGEWTFEEWATAHDYTPELVDEVNMLHTERENRLAREEGKQIVSEIDRYAADPQYADVKDQIEDIGDYVRQVMGLTDREPGQL